ncbi:MAG: helix-turn-helix transcriptional regulator [Candidatus Aminicenantes bacterium]|nr:helix-turn-helix transcriptional regulator [Candidatus Aminicenantes bacterium]
MEMLTRLEELVLIAVLKLKNEAYGTAVFNHIASLTGRDVTVSSVYFPLERLVRRGCLQALQGESTPKRGGMGKRYYRLTESGLAALEQSRALNLAAWRGVAALLKSAEA